MLTDPIWWFYLFWLPRFLQETFHTSISTNRTPIVVVYLISIVGSVGGGLLSSAMLAGGRSLNAARKTALLICALMVLPILYAPYSKSLWVVVALVGLAAAGHQGWSANLFTLASDLFPKAAVASVTGIGGMAGAIAGAGFQLVAGYVAKSHPNCAPLFIVAGLAYISALAVIQILSPSWRPPTGLRWGDYPAGERPITVSFVSAMKSRSKRNHQVARLTHALEGQRGRPEPAPRIRLRPHRFRPALPQPRGYRSSGAPAHSDRHRRSPRAPCVEIPVCYGGEFGPDLEDVARHAGLSPERVVELHAAADYLVYFVGFSTCFPYLGGLPPETVHAAPFRAAQARARRQRGHRRQPGRHLPAGLARRLRIVDVRRSACSMPRPSPPPRLRMGDRVRFRARPTAL